MSENDENHRLILLIKQSKLIAFIRRCEAFLSLRHTLARITRRNERRFRDINKETIMSYTVNDETSEMKEKISTFQNKNGDCEMVKSVYWIAAIKIHIFWLL